MPQVDLSNLSGPELRRLLDTTRQSGQAEQSYKILQEMAARREGRARQKPARRPRRTRPSDEPRTLVFNLDDPPESQAEPAPPPSRRKPLRARRPKDRSAPGAGPTDAAPPAEAPPTALPPALPPGAIWHSLNDRDRDRELDPDLDPPPDEPVGLPDRDRPSPFAGLTLPHAPRLTRGRFAAGVAVGLAAGVALGWWVGGGARKAPSPPAPVAAAFRTAALATEPPPAAPPQAAPAAQAARVAVPEPAAPDLGAVPAASPEAAEAAPAAAGESTDTSASPLTAAAEPAPINAIPRAVAAPASPAEAGACATEPTPADRVICGDARLRRLQRELRQAYAVALGAHEDRALLRQRQIAWAEARDTVTDPHRLAALYAQRIRRLNGATAEALRER